MVADSIEDVDQFGDVSLATKITISKIISKSRKLCNQTVQLFLGSTEEQVHLFDCTRR